MNGAISAPARVPHSPEASDLGASSVRVSRSIPNAAGRVDAPLTELEPGMYVGDGIRLKSKLGHGAMGSVWIAEHIALGSDVAVKFIAGDIAKSRDAIARFTREATAAAQINSPYIVRMFDHGVTANGLPYTVMELLEGEDLAKRLERDGRLPVREVSEILTQVCKALSRAHALGIVHRDIKPDNIFLVDAGGETFAKVLDFGIAKRTGPEAGFAVTGTGLMVGTPYYMSPEQILSSRDVDFRADVWSLGVVAYHALTGVLPFDGETLGALCISIDRAEPTPITHLCPELPAELGVWFARALCREAGGRFASAREAAEAFASAVGLFSVRSSGVRAIEPAHSAIAPAPAMPKPLHPSHSKVATRSIGLGVALCLAGLAGVAATAGVIIGGVASFTRPQLMRAAHPELPAMPTVATSGPADVSEAAPLPQPPPRAVPDVRRRPAKKAAPQHESAPAPKRVEKDYGF